MTAPARTAKDPRCIVGWAAADATLSAQTLNAIGRSNPHAAFPISGDARPRPAWLVLGLDESRALANAPKPVAK